MENIHRLSAAVVFAFLCLHMANHAVGLSSADTHMGFMAAVRLVYRHPAVEAVVLAAFAVQVLTGVHLAMVIWRRQKDFAHQLLALSGVYLAFFILTHVALVLVVRFGLHLDSNIHLITAGLTVKPWSYVLIPYYALGLFALFLHMGLIGYGLFKKTNKPLGWGLVVLASAAGAYVSWLWLTAFIAQGADVPEVYGELYKTTWQWPDFGL